MPQTNPQFRLFRLNLFLMDFRDAQNFARHIIRKKFHDVKNDRAVAKLVHLAFNTSLIVAYCRPFKANVEIMDGKEIRVLIDKTIVPSILTTVQEQALHQKVIDMRDKIFAHSDSSAREIEGFDYEGDTVLFYKAVAEPLTRSETTLLNNIIKTWIENLERQRSDMKAQKTKASAE